MDMSGGSSDNDAPRNAQRSIRVVSTCRQRSSLPTVRAYYSKRQPRRLKSATSARRAASDFSGPFAGCRGNGSNSPMGVAMIKVRDFIGQRYHHHAKSHTLTVVRSL